MSELSQQFADVHLHEDPTVLHKKKSQRFTVNRQTTPGLPMPSLSPVDPYTHSHLDRTLSNDSSESLPYGYAQPPAWFNPVIQRPDMSNYGPPPHHQPPPMMQPASLNMMDGPPSLPMSLGLLPGQEDVTDQIIPTAIVIKNIPFSVPREQVMAIMESLQLAPPYAFNYHYDIGPGSTTSFRGLAFANFRDPAETTAALAALNGYEIQGRRLRVEYKRVLRHGEKEKIEREKAIKRMRSAAGLNANGLPYSAPQIPFQPNLQPIPPPPLHIDPEYASASQHISDSVAQQQQQQQPLSATSIDSSNVWAAPQPLNSSVSSAMNVGSPGSDLGSGAEHSSASSSAHTRSASVGTSASRSHLDMNDPKTLEIYSRVLLFRDDSMRDELAFARSLTGQERRIVRLVAQRLGLEHKSIGEGEERYATVFKANSSEDSQQEGSSSNLKAKKSMPDMRPPSTPSSQPGMARKSNTDLRTLSRRERPNLNVFSGPIPPVPLLRPSSSNQLEEPSSPNGSLRQGRAVSDRSGLQPGRSSAASNWRTASNLDDL